MLGLSLAAQQNNNEEESDVIKRDDAFKSVVKFSTTYMDNGVLTESTGTGFFLLKDDYHLFLITANHVTKDFTNDTIVQIAGKNKQVISVKLTDLKTSHNIVDHPSADISAIEVNIPFYNTLKSDTVLYPTSIIDKNKIRNLSRDEELTSVGFPKGLGTNNLFEPLTFRSYPASNIILNVTLSSGYKSDIFVMENASCGGYSGCPVIDLGYKVNGLMTQTSNTYIYGVMHGTISDDTGGKMAIVTPAYYVFDII